jgi:hypothetical protein
MKCIDASPRLLADVAETLELLLDLLIALICFSSACITNSSGEE